MTILGVLAFTLFVSAVSSADPFCPQATEILPCTCATTDGRPSISCSFINDENQLANIFTTDFPVTNLQKFQLTNSSITALTRNVFGNVSFELIQLDSSYLDSVSPDAFDSSINTLKQLHVNNGPVSGFSFPFPELDKFPILNEFTFSKNQITTLPLLSSKSLRIVTIAGNLLSTLPRSGLTNLPILRTLDFENNIISTIEEGAFTGTDQLYGLALNKNQLTELPSTLFTEMSNLIYLFVGENQISTIEPGTFQDLVSLEQLKIPYNRLKVLNVTTFGRNPKLQIIDAKNNFIETIEPGTFAGSPSMTLIDFSQNNLTRIKTGTFNGLTKASVYLGYNNIDYVETDSFGAIANSTIHLDYNKLTTLFEFWIRPLLDRDNQVFVTGNTFTCGCEISWIFEDSTYQFNIFGQCPDGTYISDLDPTAYATCKQAKRHHRLSS